MGVVPNITKANPLTATVSASQPPPPFCAPFNPPAPTLPSQPLGTHTPLAPTTPTLPAPTTPTLPTPTTANNPMQQGVPRKPLPVKAASNALPSTEINGSKLIPVSTVLLKYPKLKGESKAGTLAVKLAREALFGDAVLAKCTPFGNREQPALPTNELNRLKEELFQLFPQYLLNPAEFESLWRVCTMGYSPSPQKPAESQPWAYPQDTCLIRRYSVCKIIV